MNVTVRYKDYTERINIKPCKKKMWRVAHKDQVHLPRAVRVEQILEALKEEPGLSYRALGRKIGIDASQVYRIIKEENIQRI